MSVCSATRSLSDLTQLVLDGIQTGNSNLFSQINIQIELVKGIIRELPIMATRKNDILFRLDQAQIELQTGVLPGDTAAGLLSAVLQILQVVTLKIQNICCG
jgi:hypothetical protein